MGGAGTWCPPLELLDDPPLELDELELLEELAELLLDVLVLPPKLLEPLEDPLEALLLAELLLPELPLEP